MRNELVKVQTKDGVTLHGAWFGDAAASRVAVCIHGTGGNFYGSTLFDALAERLLRLGFAVLRVNTRGHDGVNTAATVRGGERFGAAYEIVDDCRRDLTAWTRFARDRGAERVTLVGHSMGAIKSIYAAAKVDVLTADGVVAISPPRLSYSWFLSTPASTDFRQAMNQAEAHVASGNGRQLMEVGFPLPMIIAASAYVEKYGPEEKYDFLKYLPALAISTLVTLGSIEIDRNWAFRDLPEAIARNRRPDQPLTVKVVDEADHFYSGRKEQLCDVVDDWLVRHP